MVTQLYENVFSFFLGGGVVLSKKNENSVEENVIELVYKLHMTPGGAGLVR